MNDGITIEQLRALEPFGMMVAGMEEAIRAKDDGDLADLLAAANAVSPTNCWCSTFAAAPLVRKFIESEQALRKVCKP